MKRKWLVAGASALVVAGALSGCGQSSGPVHGEASEILPSETLTDWASYSDKLALVRVVKEHVADEPSDTDTAGGGIGYVGRSVTVRVLKEFWTRPTFDGELPKEFTYYAPGWAQKDGKRVDFIINGGPRVGLSQTYLVPLALTDRGWYPLTISTTMPADATGRVSDNLARTNEPGQAIRAAEGKSGPAIARLLAATQPDPRMAGYENLNATDRWHKAIESQLEVTVEPSESPGEG